MRSILCVFRYVVVDIFFPPFSRQVLATFLGVQDREDWKACVESKEAETKIAAVFKKDFKPFDWSL